MHIHFLGICGTFMGSLALLAREMGHQVSGSDANVYPPMSTQLENAGINIIEGYGAEQFMPKPDLIIIGNALSRGNEAVEYVLNNQLAYSSGPQWLADNLLQSKWVLAVAGTHGKTTTSSMLAWILEYAGYQPGFLIGGVPNNFEFSARLGNSDFFVIEADEYDTAFFDKRSKFVHYHPRTLVLNNLEYDHADIFPNIEAIETQFHHLMRVLPEKGLVVYPAEDHHLNRVIKRGCWSERASLEIGDDEGLDKDKLRETSSLWRLVKQEEDGSKFNITHATTGQKALIEWDLIGDHNVQNAYSACVAAFHVGVPLEQSADALAKFKSVKKRMELLEDLQLKIGSSVRVYDDFAHHPTAIASTLKGLRASVGDEEIIAIIEPRSNTMKMGVHESSLNEACECADQTVWFLAGDENKNNFSGKVSTHIFQEIDQIINHICQHLRDRSSVNIKNTHVVIMSNGGFSGIHQRLIKSLQSV